MKKMMIMGLAIAGLVIASCVNPIDQYLKVSNKAVMVTFQAQQVDESGTKTIRNNDKTVSWMPSDKISIICGSDKGLFTSTNTENALLASFTGELTEATVNAIKSGTNDPIWALYPYDENVVSDGTSVTTTLPANQTGVAGTFADDLFISLAKSNDLNLSFYNVCSGFKFSVTKAGVTSITIQGKNNEDLAGKVKLSFGLDGKPKVDEVIEGQKTITLTPEKSTFEVRKDYYFVTLPLPFTDGFTITLNTTCETGVFDVNKSVTFPRRTFIYKPLIDGSIIYGPKVGNIIIPDTNFKEYCVENFDGIVDGNKDGEISYSEALAVTEIDVNTDNIEFLTGIEYFTNLKNLRCCGSTIFWDSSLQINVCTGKLTNLDVSNNTALKNLDCRWNQLTSLDFSNNSLLIDLECSGNQLTSLDVSNNTALMYLSCNYNFNHLTSLDVSNNTALMWLYCRNNQLTNLDVSNNTALKNLDCRWNQLTSLDFSNNSLLIDLECSSNQLTSLDVSNNTALIDLECSSNQLTSLDVSNNTALTYLDCRWNQLTSLDVSNNTPTLTTLMCDENPYLTEIWLKTGQTITVFQYDKNVATIKYK